MMPITARRNKNNVLLRRQSCRGNNIILIGTIRDDDDDDDITNESFDGNRRFFRLSEDTSSLSSWYDVVVWTSFMVRKYMIYMCIPSLGTIRFWWSRKGIPLTTSNT